MLTVVKMSGKEETDDRYSQIWSYKILQQRSKRIDIDEWAQVKDQLDELDNSTNNNTKMVKKCHFSEA